MNTDNPYSFSSNEANDQAQQQSIDSFMMGPLDPTLVKEATPTPITGFEAPSGDITEKVNDAFPFTEPDSQSNKEIVIQDEFKVDPVTAQSLARIPDSDDLVIGSYVQNGEIFVFVDTINRDKAYNHEAKKLAYEYRFAVHMPMAGIEAWGAPTVLFHGDKPESPLLKRGLKSQRIYRAIFKLTRPL